MFVVTVQFTIDPAHYPAFMHAMRANAADSRKREPGCIAFDVCEDPAQSGLVFLYEIYRDAAAFEQHKRELHFLDFDRTVKPWILARALTIYTLVDR